MRRHIVIIAVLAVLAAPVLTFGAQAKKKAVPAKKPAAQAAADTKRLTAIEERLGVIGARAEENSKRLEKKITDNAQTTEKLVVDMAVLNARLDERPERGVPSWFFAAVLAAFAAGLFIIARYAKRLVMVTVGREVERRLAEVKVSAELFTAEGGIETPAYVRRGGKLSDFPEMPTESAAALSEEPDAGGRRTAPRDEQLSEDDEPPHDEVVSTPFADAGVAAVSAVKRDEGGIGGVDTLEEGDIEAKEPVSSQESFDMGIMAHRDGDLDEAIKHFDAAIAADKEFAAAYNQRGLAYAEAKNYAKAIEDYGNAILLDNRNAATYLNIIELLTVVNEFKRAEDLLVKGKAFIKDVAERAEAACLECVLKKITGLDPSDAEAGYDEALLAPFSPGEWSLRLLPAWAETSDACSAHRDYVLRQIARFKGRG